MNLGEKVIGTKAEFVQYLYQVVNQLTGVGLTLEGKHVTIPDGAQLNYRVKYSEDSGESKFSLKVVWPNDLTEEKAADVPGE